MSLVDRLLPALQLVRRGAPLCVAYSGGADSTALLHALAQLPQARECGLRALHVDHGLHADSARWAEHCANFCAALDVPLAVVRVEVTHGLGEGPEGAARRARNAAFAQALRPGEWLALAHHRDDQVETVLLKLLRGAGPHGLAGMRERRPLAQGVLWRPLLHAARAELREYVAAHGLPFIEDPSNADARLSRNFLRSEILPRLHACWPQAAQSILHSADSCRETAEYLDTLVESAVQSLACEDGTLEAAGWSALQDALRALVLERWLHARGLPAPTRVQRAELRRQVDEAREDHVPCIAWPGAEVRVWRGALHAMPPSTEVPQDWECAWLGEPLRLPGGGSLALCGGSAAPCARRFEEPLQVRFRRGGERIKPAGDAHTRELRDLLQRGGIPPWLRAQIPLVYRDNELLAVANLWLSEAGHAFFAAHGTKPHWAR